MPSPDDLTAATEAAHLDAHRWQREATAAPPSDAHAVGEAWIERLTARGALLGYGRAGRAADDPVNLIDTGLTESEFDAWTRAEGWTVPAHIRWTFVPPLRFASVGPAAERSIRMWPASTTRTGAQHQALMTGRIELRDGCLFVGALGQPAERLAWFHAEVGLDLDAAGDVILRDRVTGQTLGRIGEDMRWSGPPSADIDEDARRALQRACGHHAIQIVGSPESSERFRARLARLRDARAETSRPPHAATDCGPDCADR